MSALLLIALVPAATDVPEPPRTWPGPGFVCRMTHSEGGGAFTLSGSFGTGHGFDSVAVDSRRTWVYTFPDARIADSEIRFSGPAMDARTGMLGAFDAVARAGLTIAYPRTGGGMELVIEGAAAASRPAQLLGYRHGERVARGTCTLIPAGAEPGGRAAPGDAAMVSPFVLAALQLSAQEIDGMARDFLGPERYSNRLDCVSRSRRDSAGPTPAPAYESNLVFVFPLRPHLRRRDEAPMEVRYVRTTRDGRSWLREGLVRTARLERWPNFSARILGNDGEILLESDPLSRGRVTLSGRHRTSHGPHIEERGDCRFVPEVPSNEAPAR